MDVEIKNKSQQNKNNENDYLRADYAEAKVPHPTTTAAKLLRSLCVLIATLKNIIT